MTAKTFTMYVANCFQNNKNTSYPNKIEITNFKDLKAATEKDNVCVEFEFNHRATNTFKEANAFAMDLDNDHSENPKNHKTIEDIIKAFPNVAFYYVYSRNHNKIKVKPNGTQKAARYKVHVYFPLSQTITRENINVYNNFKITAGSIFPYFDDAAADTARFYFGIKHEQDNCGEYVPGELCIDEYIKGLARTNTLNSIIKATLEDAEQLANSEYGSGWAEKWPGLKVWKDRSAIITGAAAEPGQQQYTNIGISSADFKGEPNIQQIEKCKYFEAFANKHGIQYNKRIQGTFVYYFVECPWKDQHSEDAGEQQTKITIIPLADGGASIRFNCWHAHCLDKKWTDYKAYYEQRDTAKEEMPVEANNSPVEAKENYMQAFLSAIQTEAFKPFKTGLNFFDEIMGGGVMKQTLLLLMAAPAAGKTTLCQQIAESIATTHKQVIYLNLEMSREQMLAKSISYRLAKKGTFMNATQVLQGYNWTDAQREAVTAAVDDYTQNIYPYLKYNPNDIGADLDNMLNKLKAIGNAAKQKGEDAPAVVVDYLHLISTSRGLDNQELIKQAVMGLKSYAKDYNTFVIAIAATNRDSSKSGTITLDSGRDSSNIEYTADYALSLNYTDIDNGKIKPSETESIAKLQQEQPRRMILRVLKGRLIAPGKAKYLYFDAANNFFFTRDEFVPGDYADVFTKSDRKPKKI